MYYILQLFDIRAVSCAYVNLASQLILAHLVFVAFSEVFVNFSTVCGAFFYVTAAFANVFGAFSTLFYSMFCHFSPHVLDAFVTFLDNFVAF